MLLSDKDKAKPAATPGLVTSGVLWEWCFMDRMGPCSSVLEQCKWFAEEYSKERKG